MKKRLATLAATYGEVTPQATVCCNACRTCVQTNALALLATAAVAVARRFRSAR